MAKKRTARPVTDAKIVIYSRVDPATVEALDKICEATELDIPPECKHLRRWYDAVSARPSAKA